MQLKIGSFGEVIEGEDDINQEIMLILTTPLGFIPHRPEFGSRIYEYLDKPLNLIKPLVVAETFRAIKANTDRFVPTEVSVKSIEGSKINFRVSGIFQGEEKTIELLANFTKKP